MTSSKFTIMVKRPTIITIDAPTFEDAKKMILSNLVGSGQMKPNELIEFEEVTEMVEVKEKESTEEVKEEEKDENTEQEKQ